MGHRRQGAADFGFPTGREVTTAWVLLLLLAACGGEWPVWRRAVVRDWLPVIAVLFLYDLLRGSADELGSRLADLPALTNGKTGAAGIDYAHVVAPLRADEVLFGWLTGGQVPTLWLQDRLYDPGQVHWWDIAIVPVYMSHFIVPMALAVGLWLAAYPLFRRYVWTLVVLTVLTLVTYALYPAAPPWMAGLNGYLPDVGRVTSETLQATGIGTIRSAVAGAGLRQRRRRDPVPPFGGTDDGAAVLLVAGRLAGPPAARRLHRGDDLHPDVRRRALRRRRPDRLGVCSGGRLRRGLGGATPGQAGARTVTARWDGALIWSDAAVEDVPAAPNFCRDRFDELPDMGGYATFATDGAPLGGLGGTRLRAPPGWTTCFAVASTDDAVAKSQERRGHGDHARDAPSSGFAVVGDPWGAPFSVMQAPPG